MEKILRIFDSFAEADRAARADLWALSPIQRLNILEALRKEAYGPAGSPQDFKELLRLLIVKRTKFLLIGGYAVCFHGFPRYTGDIDIWIEVSEINAQSVVAALAEFGFNLPELKPELFLEQRKIIRMGREPLRIEILTTIDGVEFSEAYENKVLITIEKDLQIPMISLADLRKNKKASGRTKDLADLEELPTKP